MKKHLRLFILAILLLTIPQVCMAFTRTITIHWSMSDTTDVTGYKMYFSYNSDMSAKTMACETSDRSVSSLTCQDVSFDQDKAYFTIAAVTASTEYESTPKLTFFGPKPVQDFKMEIVR